MQGYVIGAGWWIKHNKKLLKLSKWNLICEVAGYDLAQWRMPSNWRRGPVGLKIQIFILAC